MVKKGDTGCPECSGDLIFHDRVKRIERLDYGRRRWVYIDRMRCLKCGKIHRALPDNFIPYKHYNRTIINGFQEGIFSTNQIPFEDYPVEPTVELWRNSQFFQGIT